MTGATPVLELLVVEGDDTGQQFTLDGPEVRIARGTPQSGRPGDVLLRDPTVSRDQAMIRQSRGVTVIEHRASARSPTLLNGTWVDKRPLSPGDRIQIGRVVIEVRARGGTSLTTLLHRPEPTPPPPVQEQRTELRRTDASSFAIKLLRGWPELDGRRFRLRPERTVIGRSEECDVCIPEGGVSRVHAELVWERHRLQLVHRSATNPTFVNGSPVDEPRILEVGDEIELADRVVFKLERATVVAASQSPTSLLSHLERKLEGGEDVDAKFRVEGSFLDVDVADSYGMKAAAQGHAEGIILSFARWRAWISKVVREFEGQVLNSNGDELMCFFDEPLQAVRGGSEILQRLERFNADENLLETPFKLRIGVHTGSTLMDRERGIAFSPVLDVAGHLQKKAEVNGLLVSQDTLDRLPAGLPFEAAGPLEREGIATWRMARFLD